MKLKILFSSVQKRYKGLIFDKGIEDSALNKKLAVHLSKKDSLIAVFYMECFFQIV